MLHATLHDVGVRAGTRGSEGAGPGDTWMSLVGQASGVLDVHQHRCVSLVAVLDPERS